jgi:hypothetical protein
MMTLYKKVPTAGRIYSPACAAVHAAAVARLLLGRVVVHGDDIGPGPLDAGGDDPQV